MAVVAALAIAPVKGMRVLAVDAVDVHPAGPADDRAFHLRGADGRIAMTTRHPRLLHVVPGWVGADGELALAFPDGTRVAAPVVRGEPVTTRFYDGRPVAGHVVEGPFGAALSEHLGKPVQLVAREEDQVGGDDAPVTLMSQASLAAVRDAIDARLDGRRFRMTITIDGVAAWEEHGWGGRELRAGGAVLRVAAPVPRCVVTTRDPDDGRTDAPVLKALAALRGKDDVTFGVWCGVEQPGVIAVGDAVEPV